MRVLSAIQPTGSIHLGNYMGALRHWVAIQEKNACFYEIADLHSLTNPISPEERRANTLQTAAILRAIGIDPNRTTLFVQSEVHEHAELGWVLSCLAHVGELRRMTQFKAKTAGRDANVTVGLFVYPVLQAADILLYNAEAVPVGEDQVQHLELARDLAERFNRKYGVTFSVPRPLIPLVGARIMNLQDPGIKMSKSAGPAHGIIQLTDTPETIRKKIRAAVTDSGRYIAAVSDKPALANLLTIYAACANNSMQKVEESFAGKGYDEFKRALADLLIESLRPIRESYFRWMGNSSDLIRELVSGTSQAQRVASRTLQQVYEHLGLLQE